jgi:UDP-N-acetylmuramyl pentapeptide synthase
MEGYAPVGMRLRAEPLHAGAIALNDAYNANPQSVEASLRLLAELDGRKVAVLGDMLELGGDEAAWHQRIADVADELGLDLLLLVGPLMSKASTHTTETWSAESGLTLVERLRDWVGQGDHVLFKGSRGARVERILQAIQGDAHNGAS